MEVPNHIIYGIEGKRFCDCRLDENGTAILKTKNEEITLQSLQAQAFNPKLADARRGKHKRRHSA